MPPNTKTTWTKNNNRFETSQKPTTPCTITSFPDAFSVAGSYKSNKDISLDIDRQATTSDVTAVTLETHFPVFTVAVVIFDIFMLIIVYIVQEGTVITSATWIKMGCKYVPCMKPLYSLTERELYNTQLKSQCQSFLFPYQFFRFFTPIFLHGGITHLLSNLVYQALAGFLLEGKYGIKTLGICYILFGFSGNIISAMCNPKSSK